MTNNSNEPKNNPSTKSKLFKLKEWLTVPEAARHLSTVFDEEVIGASGTMQRRVQMENDNYPMGGRVSCGAKTRTGGVCGQTAMSNGRCRYHGGLSPSGAEHGSYVMATIPRWLSHPGRSCQASCEIRRPSWGGCRRKWLDIERPSDWINALIGSNG